MPQNVAAIVTQRLVTIRLSNDDSVPECREMKKNTVETAPFKKNFHIEFRTRNCAGIGKTQGYLDCNSLELVFFGGVVG